MTAPAKPSKHGDPCDCSVCTYARHFPEFAKRAPGWDPNAHPYLCTCSLCDGTGDPIGAAPVIGTFRVEPDGSITEIEKKDRS